jgi:hypothetical protein
VRQPLIVIMDRLPAHRPAAKRLIGDGFEIEWLPGYAPDLNPTEALWSQTKYGDMANFVPDDTLDLEVEVRPGNHARGSENAQVVLPYRCVIHMFVNITYSKSSRSAQVANREGKLWQRKTVLHASRNW